MKVGQRNDDLIASHKVMVKGFKKIKGVGMHFVDWSITHTLVERGMLTGIDLVGGCFIVLDVLNCGGIAKEDTGTDGVVHLMLPISREADDAWGTKGTYVLQVRLTFTISS